MALPTSLTLEIVSPERAIAHEEVDEVQLPGVKGYFGVLPGHTPLLAQLAVGQMWYRRGQEKIFLTLHTGIAEVLPDRVIVLSRGAERAEEIDVARAEAAAQRAQAALKQPAASMEDMERARVALMRAMVRLQVANRERVQVAHKVRSQG
jgi:F-type H+-transporting ATPase subunit epsilon